MSPEGEVKTSNVDQKAQIYAISDNETPETLEADFSSIEKKWNEKIKSRVDIRRYIS